MKTGSGASLRGFYFERNYPDAHYLIVDAPVGFGMRWKSTTVVKLLNRTHVKLITMMNYLYIKWKNWQLIEELGKLFSKMPQNIFRERETSPGKRAFKYFNNSKSYFQMCCQKYFPALKFRLSENILAFLFCVELMLSSTQKRSHRMSSCSQLHKLTSLQVYTNDRATLRTFNHPEQTDRWNSTWTWFCCHLSDLTTNISSLSLISQISPCVDLKGPTRPKKMVNKGWFWRDPPYVRTCHGQVWSCFSWAANLEEIDWFLSWNHCRMG